MAQNELLKNKKVLAFPSGLGASDTDKYGNPSQYMMFKINTDEKTTELRDDKKTGPVKVTNNRTGVGVATTTGIGDKIDKALGATVVKELDPDVILKYGSAVNRETWRVQKGMTRLDKVIILPMPNEHRVSTSIGYADEYEPSSLTKAGDIFNQLGGNVLGEFGTLVKNAGISALVNKLTPFNTNINDLLAEERLALNPKKEVMFKDLKFRQFSFQYTFAPKNEIESRTVSEIIETFRYYALPEISKSKLYYIFPSEFELSFMLGSKDNPNIPRITTSVLQRINVNYSPNSGVWATLPNGAPVAVDVTLEFLELEIVDRSRIYNADRPISSGF